MAAGWAGLPVAVAMPLPSGDNQHGALTLVQSIPVTTSTPILFHNGCPVVVARPVTQAAGMGSNGPYQLLATGPGTAATAGLPNTFKGAFVARGPPMPKHIAVAILPYFLPMLVPHMQELMWTACRKVKKNIVGNALKLVVADKMPCALGIAVVEWFAQRFPAQSSVGQDEHLQVERSGGRQIHSVMLGPEQVKELCCFDAAADSTWGKAHVRIASHLGDLRFVRNVFIRYVQTVNRNARHCSARLEMHMSTWEVNGASKAVFPGTQLPFTRSQWAVAVTTAQDVVDAWPADISEHLTVALKRWGDDVLVAPPAQAGTRRRRRT